MVGWCVLVWQMSSLAVQAHSQGLVWHCHHRTQQRAHTTDHQIYHVVLLAKISISVECCLADCLAVHCQWSSHRTLPVRGCSLVMAHFMALKSHGASLMAPTHRPSATRQTHMSPRRVRRCCRPHAVAKVRGRDCNGQLVVFCDLLLLFHRRCLHLPTRHSANGLCCRRQHQCQRQRSSHNPRLLPRRLQRRLRTARA